MGMKPNAQLDSYLQRVAAVYDAAKHRPNSTVTRLHYRTLKAELLAQYQLLTAFVDVSFTGVDPYGGSAEMFESVRRGSLAVYTQSDMPADHPFAEMSPTVGQIYNCVFRAVHDGLAHYPERNGFGRIGEFRAFRAHARLLSWLSVQALFTETVAQNAWYHFGGNGREFAPQRAVILPAELIREALTLEV
jgi:hypothetical protein